MVYRRRYLDAELASLLADVPAVMLNGPRAAGKTTTASRHATTVVRLDQPAQAAAFIADPDSALRGRAEPVLLDEWQEVPDVLGAVKRAVDDDARPGRFILTGSVRAELEQRMWPGTGRLMRLAMFGLTEREIEHDAVAPPEPKFIRALSAGTVSELQRPPAGLDLRGYVERAIRGGFPGPLFELPERQRRRWADSYLEQLLTRDGQQLVEGRDQFKLGRYLEAVALSSAGSPDHKTLYDAAGISRNTADVYDDLLERLFVAERVPPFSGNRLSRLIKTPKRYVVDGSLMAAATGTAVDTVLGDDDLLGRAIDTFVMAQLRPECAQFGARVRRSHLRTKGGREEIDIVIELPGGRIIALEIKATSAPRPGHANHLRWFRERTERNFVLGAVLHTGPDIIELDDRIWAIPIGSIWSG